MDYIWLLLGLLMLIKGSDIFVTGSSNLATAFKVPKIIIGLTVVAFGTSAPEASISITASLSGLNQLSFGNILGSNIFNLLVILGLTVFISPIKIEDQTLKRELPFMVGSSIILLSLSLFSPHMINRSEGIVLIVLFLVFLIIVIRSAKNTNVIDKNQMEHKPLKAILYIILGLSLLILGGSLMTKHAIHISRMLGLSELLIGLTVVALGTSLPELMTSITAVLKKQHALAVGNIVGSNVFNSLFILGTASIIRPIPLSRDVFMDLTLLSIVSLLTLFFAYTHKTLSRKEGFILFMIYICYLIYIIVRN